MNKYPVVILPGWMLGSKRFTSLMAEFTKAGYKTYCVDFPGFEQGMELNRVYNLSDYVRYVEKFLKQKGIAKAIFVCHSFGGRVALKLLSQEPKRAAALVISGTPGFPTVSRIRFLITMSVAKLGKIFFLLPPFSLFKDRMRRLLYRVAGATDFYHAQGLMRETFKNVVKERLGEYMQKIRLPVLLIWGSQDRLAPIAIAKRMQKTLTRSKLTIIPDRGHNFLYKEPQLIVHHTEEFLQKL
ncbi:MAG: hypothetical protein UV61_C0002G0248 [Candidatus Gottesmanbacteria bacterium GW2011_GWB1_43_11]|uniref:AB hydrolase-1 domain-containing protein n=1 Tax=Candidatus Gottesmanbacteria bacterium GW2011_GWB1_43_11 TaxID=1618446 RepID=A0A0G1CPW6_9BACT|nr:MAG: hypothetical protein UV04_C0001G0136 [Candidatus Gottesmanbacteria bacterium GW2011_GWA2_42_16]KKS56325.1 MAG: hypothetical protein UV17_C0001G0135 [Candidatus Gottesmanbacteria bacterium GW2011_GWA1_42_26]KKS82333.1 MAG: hypothetical protein UV55_C0003G0052 [Candidatus Gottesmanbacteria bacterium GW2011_GWC1_43_10]KKS87527.1 MAG: hypothetical protein UV61_C0002G0248 [Candidatus Gottesmanbacteria bacterium GW2011_GWB1_43_11]OGG10343.1 MAG: hypothetical protein A2699_00855 [Candidatus Go